MIAAGALAVTATLLAGCGGKSSEVTAASTPAAPEPTAADVPTSVTDGLVKPAGVSDEDWAGLGVVATSATGANNMAYFEKVIFVSLGWVAAIIIRTALNPVLMAKPVRRCGRAALRGGQYDSAR